MISSWFFILFKTENADFVSFKQILINFFTNIFSFQDGI